MPLRTVLTSNTFEQQRQTINLIGSDLDTLATGFNSSVLAALSPSNTTVTISPTGTGSVTINPATAGTINNTSIGATTKSTGAFTTLEVRDTTTVALDLFFASNSSVALSADRTLTFDVTNANRTIKLAGNIDIANNFTTSGNFAVTLTSTAATTATLPSGTVTLLASGGALGTPSSGTLSSCSGLPVSGITASTSTALGVGSIELGNTTDTTISRSAAGRIAVEGNDVAHRGDATFIGTTSVALNRATAALALTGISSITGDTGTSTIALQTASTAVASTASGQITISSGNATGTTSNSGNITIDVGTATLTKGNINIGPTNATTVNLPTGRTKIGNNTTLTQSAFAANITFPQYDVVLSPLPYMVRISANRNKTTNNTTLEPVFPTTNDTIALYLDTLYYFQGYYFITTAASASAHVSQIGFTFTQTPVDFWCDYTWRTGSPATSTEYRGYVSGLNSISFGEAGSLTSQQHFIKFEGWFKSAAAPAADGGTLTPTFTQSVVGTSASPQIMLGSWFSIQPMGSGAPNIISGTWA
jgi:hypothetical protein